MTTSREIASWLQPLLAEREYLSLVRRNLVLKPVRHMLRGIYFDASSDKDVCRPIWYINSIFRHSGSSISFGICGHFSLKPTSDQGFLDHLYQSLDEVLKLDFALVTTVEDFLRATEPLSLNGNMLVRRTLSSMPRQHAVVLAALGRIAEAAQAVAAALEQLEKSKNGHRAVAEAERAQRSNSAVAKLHQELTDRDDMALERVRSFARLLDGRDRAQIAAQLHAWERQTAKNWDLEHLWEPTPFPIELGAGE